MKRLFVDMDGTLCEFGKAETPEELFVKGFFLNRPPHQKVVAAIRRLAAAGVDVYILSCYLTESKYALSEKQAWLRKYLPEIKEERWLFVPYGTDKLAYLLGNGMVVTKQDYLLDDYTVNLLEWSTAGTGIKMLTDINHTNRTWSGAMVSYNDPALAERILKIMYPEVPHGGKRTTSYPIVDEHELSSAIACFMTRMGYKSNEEIGNELFGMVCDRKKFVFVYKPDSLEVVWFTNDRPRSNQPVTATRVKHLFDLCTLSMLLTA